MKIEHLKREKNGTRERIAATVTWENRDRGAQEVYFETERQFGSGLSCNPHAFLLGCIYPAMYHGEERVFIDAEICPEFRDGLITAISWIHHWYYGSNHKLVQIEAKTQSRPPNQGKTERAACFFSGGIDCLAILRSNRHNFPSEHPGSIRDGLIIYGQNIESDNRPQSFEKAVDALSAVAKDAEIALIPIYTNIRSLEEDTEFFLSQFHGAILGAVAHAISQRLTSATISSSDDIPNLSLLKRQNLKPFGSHPLTDPNYSSSELRIRHEGLTLSRLDRTKLVVDWDVALQHIKVCQPNWPGENCGQCEKCVRTMLALVALGALDKTGAFPHNDVSEEMVSKIKINRPLIENSYSVEDDYLELIPFLRKRGRHDLVRAIERLIERYRNPEGSSIDRIRRYSRKRFKSNAVKLMKLIV